MWEKIKKILAIIGATISAIFFALFCRRKTNERGSTGNTERDNRIEKGIGECEERVGTISDSLGRAKDGVGECEEHLQRAENILRNAVERSRKEKPNT